MENSIHYSIPAICYGEVLWDVLPDGLQPGGAPLNVCHHLNKLGVGAAVITRIGHDKDGEQLKKLMIQWNQPLHLVQHDANFFTGRVIAQVSTTGEVEYEIIYPVAWDLIEESSILTAAVKEAEYLVYGTLASRNATSRDTLFTLLETDAIKVYDVNLRAPYVFKFVIKYLLHKSDIVKFNHNELLIVADMFGMSGNEQDMVKFIQDKFDIREVLVTKGVTGASYYIEDQTIFCPGQPVIVKDTIGCGDSFLSAFIASHRAKIHPEQRLRNAIRMGEFVATMQGGCPDYQLKAIDFINYF